MKALFNRIKLFLTVVTIRLRAESPRFFRKLFRFFLTLGVMASLAYPAFVEFVNELTIYQVVVPAWLNSLIKFIGAMSAGAALVSKLAVNWDSLPEREQKILDKKPQV
ncbi:hypothetical protein GCM10028803_00230 [Larkinella knui]|uniref:Holin n=1 Tax=Larkinella knui TaxID=2025310 RepID=A0A3P1CJ99_9BACT|nr:hypothetical protein [Larkinella knui]RRB13431.1 hypothetical protein EHT87_14235 [Larkinella knui]